MLTFMECPKNTPNIIPTLLTRSTHKLVRVTHTVKTQIGRFVTNLSCLILANYKILHCGIIILV